MQAKVALVAALEKASADEWSKVYGIARRALTPGSKVTKISVDLSHRDKAIESLAKCKDATHLFFCAYQSTGSFSKDVAVNVSMFTNMIEAAEAAGCKLQHVHFVSGTKWYGNHIGPIKTPSREDDPRAMPPNFYYNFEDYCTQRVADGAPWTWSSVRPNPVCGFSTGSVMNLTMTLAVYASICKAQGLPFRFPGTPQAYHALLEVIDVELLAESMQWCSTQKSCQNRSFNVSNGDVFRWSEVWPILGEWFGLKTAEPQHFSMVDLLADQEGTWAELQEAHGLQPIPYNEIATWAFGDWVFGQEQDWFSNVTRMRQTGFQGMQIDSRDMFLRQFQELRAEKIIP
eukprot:jgi/Astpho2/9922/Aster-06629